MLEQNAIDKYQYIPINLRMYVEAQMKTGRVTSSFDAHVTANLGFIAGLLGNIAQVELSAGYTVYSNLYSYIIGETGKGKSGYLRPGLKLISKIQIEKDALYRKEKERRHKLKKELEQENKKRKANDESLVFDQNLKSDYPVGVFNTKYPLFTGDFTIEGLQELAALTTGGNFFVVRDEFAGTFNTFEKTGRQNDIPFLNEAYEASGSYSVTRKMKEAKIPPIYNLCSNMLGGIQKKAVYRMLDRYEKRGDGDALHARFQNLSILDFQREDQDAVAVNPSYTKAFEDIVRQIVDERVVFSKMESEEHAPYTFRLSPEAEALYKNFCRDNKPTTKGDLFDEFIEKTPTFLLKIGLIFHILKKQNNIFIGTTQDLISGETMYEASKYVRTKIEYAKQLYRVESSISIRTESAAEKLKKYLNDEETAFYKKFTAKKELWSTRDLAFTHQKSLPTKQNNSIDYEALSSILQYLVNEEQLYSIEEEHPRNKSIIKKYSLFPIEIPTPPDNPDNNKSGGDNSGSVDKISFVPPVAKMTATPVFNKKTYSSNISLKDHLRAIKDKIDVRDFLKKYLDIKKGVALCPFHDDRNPSLSVTKEYYHCFSCGSHGDSLDFLINLRGLSFKDALKELEYYSNTNPIVVKEELKADNTAYLQKQLNEIWEGAIFTSDEKPYLKKRLNMETMPLNIASVKYHPRLQYSSIGNDKLFYPGLVSSISDKFGNLIGLQRTYLSDDFTVKRDLSPARKILGRLSGGYVVLDEYTANNTLYIGEGVESVYSGKLLRGIEGSYYAALSSTNLPDLPSRFDNIIILADNDEAGISFAERMKEKYGDKVSVLFPGAEYKDFNDQLWDMKK